MLDPLRPDAVAVHTGAVPLPYRVEVRGLDDAAQVADAERVAAGLAVPVMGPEHPGPVLGDYEIVGVCVLQTDMNLPPDVVALKRYSLAADLPHQVGQQGRR